MISAAGFFAWAYYDGVSTVKVFVINLRLSALRTGRLDTERTCAFNVPKLISEIKVPPNVENRSLMTFAVLANTASGTSSRLEEVRRRVRPATIHRLLQ